MSNRQSQLAQTAFTHDPIVAARVGRLISISVSIIGIVLVAIPLAQLADWTA